MSSAWRVPPCRLSRICPLSSHAQRDSRARTARAHPPVPSISMMSLSLCKRATRTCADAASWIMCCISMWLADVHYTLYPQSQHPHVSTQACGHAHRTITHACQHSQTLRHPRPLASMRDQPQAIGATRAAAMALIITTKAHDPAACTRVLPRTHSMRTPSPYFAHALTWWCALSVSRRTRRGAGSCWPPWRQPLPHLRRLALPWVRRTRPPSSSSPG